GRGASLGTSGAGATGGILVGSTAMIVSAQASPRCERPAIMLAFMPDPQQRLAERLLSGDKRALARAISLVEDDDPEGWELVRQVYPKTGKAAVVGFTGPPGVGKSTLIGRLVANARSHERDVAVLSIDPSSPFTQGALLGDRIRLTEH